MSADQLDDTLGGMDGTISVDVLPDSPCDDTNVVAKHNEVVSVMRKRVSSSHFRVDDNTSDPNNNSTSSYPITAGSASAGAPAVGAVSSGGGAVDTLVPPEATQSATRQRAPSLPVQLSMQEHQNNPSRQGPPLVAGSTTATTATTTTSPPKHHKDPTASTAEVVVGTATAAATAIAAVGETTEKKKNAAPQAQQQQQRRENINAQEIKKEEEVSGDATEEATEEEKEQALQQQEQERWRLRKKHIFIFSDAGKPIFTRWGDEADFSELFGILQVLMEMSVSNGLGALKHVCLGSHDVHFMSDEHLRFVMVTATGEPPDTCQHQMRMICHCLLSGFPTVNRMLDRNSGFDVRSQLLHPSVFRSLVKSMNHEIPMIFQGIDCGFFDPNLRGVVNEVLRKDGFAGYESSDSDDGGGHLMSLIVCRGKILAWGQIPNFQLSTDDLLLLIHFSERCCGTMSSLDNTWAPLCLPDYDREGSFWVHVMQLANDEQQQALGGGGAAAASSSSSINNIHSQSPLLIQLATHTEAIGQLKQSAQRVKDQLQPLFDKLARASAKVMSLPGEWMHLGVMHVLFNRWGVVAYTAPPPHAQEVKHRKDFLRTLLSVRAEALNLSKTARPFLMRASPFETVCFSRKVVRLKSAALGRASAELFVTFLPGTEASAISSAVNRIWDAMLNKDAWVQFVAARQNFNVVAS